MTVLLALMMMVPAAGLAEERPVIELAGVYMYVGDYLYNSADSVSSSAPSSDTGYAYLHEEDGNRVLLLYNYDNMGKVNPCYILFFRCPLTVRLVGSNTFDTEGGKGTYGFWDEHPLTIEAAAGGTLTVNASGDASSALAVEDAVTITGGKLDLTSNNTCLFAREISISNAELTAESAQDLAVYTTGMLEIDGSELDLTVYADGVYAEKAISITDTSLTATSEINNALSSSSGVTVENSILDLTSYESGIRAGEGIAISGSDLTVTSTETSAFSASCGVTVEDSSLDLTSAGSCFSAEGDITITDAILNATTNSNGIYSESDILIKGSTLDLKTDGNGVWAEGDVTTTDTSLTVAAGEDNGIKASEGNITLVNSNLDLTADEVGITAKGGTVNITGGVLDIPYRNCAISGVSVNCSLPGPEGFGAYGVGEDITACFILDYASAVESVDRNIRHVHLPCQSADVLTTGDNASLALWAMMAVLSVCGLWMLSRKRCMR